MGFRKVTAAWVAVVLVAAGCSGGGAAVTTAAPTSTSNAVATSTAPPSTTTTTAVVSTTTSTTRPPTTTSTTAPPATTTTTLPDWWREITPDAPLRVWVIGDSLTPHVGTALRALGTASGLMQVSVEPWGGTGLARPDVFDWFAFVADNPPAPPPDAIVVLLGANDGQGMSSPGGWLDFGTAEWDARYGTLAGGLMDQLLGLSSRVYWVGLPIMGGPNFDAHGSHISEILREQAALRLEARFIESYSVFQDETGGFALELPDAEGTLVTVRSTDGIHFTPGGGQRLADVIWEVLAADWRLPTG